MNATPGGREVVLVAIIIMAKLRRYSRGRSTEVPGSKELKLEILPKLTVSLNLLRLTFTSKGEILNKFGFHQLKEGNES